MAWTQADLDALDTALKRDTLQVQFGDRTVRYHSKPDLLAVRQLAAREIAKAQATARGGSPLYSVANFRQRSHE